MNAHEFKRHTNWSECERVAKAAGTTLAYFKQIMYGHRYPSRDLAIKLAEASGGRMTARRLLNV